MIKGRMSLAFGALFHAPDVFADDIKNRRAVRREQPGGFECFSTEAIGQSYAGSAAIGALDFA